MDPILISSNLTPVSNDYTVGYQPMTKEQKEAAKAQNVDTYELSDERKQEIKDIISRWKIPNLLEVQGKPVNAPLNHLVSSYRTVTGRDGSTFEVLYNSNAKTGQKYRSGYLNVLAQEAAGIKNSDYGQYFTKMK